MPSPGPAPAPVRAVLRAYAYKQARSFNLEVEFTNFVPAAAEPLAMTSAEPEKRSAYSKDIALRVVWMRLGMNLSFRSIAYRLQIGLGSAYRLYQRFERTGSFLAPKRSDRPQCKKLDEQHELFILALLMENPGLYLVEMCLKIQEVTGTTVSGATVCRLLRKHGYTRKKIRQVAKQRSEELRGLFMARVLQFPREFFVWLDETGSDNRDQIRKFGYSLRGVTPVYNRYIVRGTRISSVVAMASQGVLTHDFVTGTMNGEKFFDFVRGKLIPCMQPFPGPNSILVMDNCSIHHVEMVKEELEHAGIMVIFLPPYSPDYNPCEELFSYAEYYLKNHDQILQCSNEPKEILKSAFESVTQSQCNNWITHAGYGYE